MAAHPQLLITALLITLVLAAGVNFSASYVLKGSVSCIDCNNAHHDLSGIKVSVKCSHEKKLGMATTGEDGSFETTMASKPPLSGGCSAKILGATRQLYVPKTAEESKIVEAHGYGHYTTSEPLRFYSKCPNKKCGSPDLGGLGSSKTFDLPPVPRDWGIAPASYYLPFIPIIGIP